MKRQEDDEQQYSCADQTRKGVPILNVGFDHALKLSQRLTSSSGTGCILHRQGVPIASLANGHRPYRQSELAAEQLHPAAQQKTLELERNRRNGLKKRRCARELEACEKTQTKLGLERVVKDPTNRRHPVHRRGRRRHFSMRAVDATAFFAYVRRRRDGMKMKRQEEYRQEQEQGDQAEAPGGVGYGKKCWHKTSVQDFECFVKAERERSGPISRSDFRTVAMETGVTRKL